MSYALNIRAEGYPRDVGPFPTREAAETWMAGRKLTGSWNTYPITPPEQATPGCGECRKCVGETAMAAAAAGDWWRSIPVGMVVCPDCGNKRCPRASYHDNPCTSSNEPGQPTRTWCGKYLCCREADHVGACEVDETLLTDEEQAAIQASTAARINPDIEANFKQWKTGKGNSKL